MAYNLILSSDTLDIGRQKINEFMQSSAGVWSSDTPNYSIISTQGTNTNQAAGNYSFVTGKNNTASTGNFQVITGGYKNISIGPFGSVLGGTINKQSNSQAKYNAIFNGKSNTISETDVSGSNTLRGYNSILNGQSNTVDGQANLLQGASNNIQGNFTVSIGSSNTVAKNSAYPSTTKKGPQFNTIFGVSNKMTGSEFMYHNFIKGNYNSISANTGTGVGGSQTRGNTIFGNKNLVFGSSVSNVFQFGEFLSNLDQNYGFSQRNLFMVGVGTSASKLRPYGLSPGANSSPYQFILGSSGDRKVRIMFGSSPNAYLDGGAWQTSGADYGEYFEWKDKNVNKENRVGYFVEIIDGMVQIAKNGKPIGIVSKDTAFIGDSNQDGWAGIYLKDEWGETLKEKLSKFTFNPQEGEVSDKIVYFDENGFCLSEIPKTRHRESIKIDLLKEQCKFIEEIEIPLVNPEYDPEKKYVSRKKRDEWDVIGLLGKLRVRTMEPITANAVDVDTATGMAKNGTTYPVLKKIKDFDGNYGIVQIFFK